MASPVGSTHNGREGQGRSSTALGGPKREDITPRGTTSDGVHYVIDIVGLSKTFKRRTRARGSGYTTLKSTLLSAIRRVFASRPAPVSDETVTHAIKDLTLRIPKGASVGLIGRNGSGKSTFLKLVTGIYKPDVGSLHVAGRVSALIELGAGFHPDFTGRENLFLAGVMHGLTKSEIEDRFDEIVDFAELRHVIDDPVRTYSSGMFMRLGFSIAIHTDPDVLLVDEVLAVGDAGFVAKCKDRIAELRKAGKTLVLVTHDLDAVERWCDEVIWLNAGEVKERGYPRRVIDAYRQYIEKGEEAELFAKEGDAPQHSQLSLSGVGTTQATEINGEESSNESLAPSQPKRWGSREIEITEVEIYGAEGTPKRVLHTDDTAKISIHYRINSPVTDVVFGIGINRADGLVVSGTNSHIERVVLPALKTEGVLNLHIARLGLLEGAFSLDCAVHREDGYPFDYHKDLVHFTVRSPYPRVGVTFPSIQWDLDGTPCKSAPVVSHSISDQQGYGS